MHLHLLFLTEVRPPLIKSLAGSSSTTQPCALCVRHASKSEVVCQSVPKTLCQLDPLPDVAAGMSARAAVAPDPLPIDGQDDGPCNAGDPSAAHPESPRSFCQPCRYLT